MSTFRAVTVWPVGTLAMYVQVVVMMAVLVVFAGCGETD